jgi:hypothetical protein
LLLALAVGAVKVPVPDVLDTTKPPVLVPELKFTVKFVHCPNELKEAIVKATAMKEKVKILLIQ